jgi:hypothetical protein
MESAPCCTCTKWFNAGNTIAAAHLLRPSPPWYAPQTSILRALFRTLCSPCTPLAAIIVWLTVSVLVDVPSAILGPALGLTLAPCMAKPYRAAGLGEFWGRRYNLVVSSTLRFSVFEPLMQALRCCRSKAHRATCTDSEAGGGVGTGGEMQRGSTACSSSQRCRRCWLASAVATTAAFAVSGLMHEMCVW